MKPETFQEAVAVRTLEAGPVQNTPLFKVILAAQTSFSILNPRSKPGPLSSLHHQKGEFFAIHQWTHPAK